MRKLKIIEHISLDGVIQNSNDDDDFPHSGPPQCGNEIHRYPPSGKS